MRFDLSDRRFLPLCQVRSITCHYEIWATGHVA